MEPIQLQLPTGTSRNVIMERAAMIEDAILAHLEIVDMATVKELAVTLSLPATTIRVRVMALNDMDQVKPVHRLRANGTASQWCSWALGSGDKLTSSNDAKVTWNRAEQVGMKRDPLIAALFGPAKADIVAPALPVAA